MGTKPESIAAEAARQSGRVIEAIDALRHSGRSLQPIDPTASADTEALLSVRELIDPERPVDPEQLVEQFVPQAARASLAGRAARFGAALLLTAVLAAAWRWTPLHDWVALDSIVSRAQDIADSAAVALALLAVYVAGGLLMIPVSILIVATGMLFGPFLGALYALCGMLLSAAVTYWIGGRLARDTVRWLAGERLNPLTVRLSKHGALSIAAVRVLAIASFSVVNLVAGASHVRLQDLLSGTAIGMIPGLLLMVVFADRVSAVIIYPGLATFGWLVVVIAVGAGGATLVWRVSSARDAAAATRIAPRVT